MLFIIIPLILNYSERCDLSSPKKILIIDDEPDISEMVTEFLLSSGYAAYYALNGPDGLALIEKEKPDVMILDLKMPGMDGIELCRRVKETQPDLDVILMTAYASMDNVLAAMAAGVYDFLVKPFEDLNEVLHKIFSGDMRAPSEVRPEIPFEMESVIMRAVARLPERRYPDAATFRKALQKAWALVRESAAPPPPPLPSPPSPPASPK